MLSRFLAGLVLVVATATGLASGIKPLSDDHKITSGTSEFDEGIVGELEQIVASHHGTMGIYCHNFASGETIAINANESFPTASTIKLAVLCTAMNMLATGTGPFKTYYDTKPYDASTSTGGSGFIRNYKDKTPMELKELIHLMITVSDNIATNMLCEWIGLEPVNKWLSDHGFEKTRMYSTIGGSLVFDQEGRKEWGLGRTTPHEMGSLMEMIATGKAGTTSTTEEMLRVLGHQYFDGGIPAGIPPMTYVGSKSGALNRSRSDNAIVAAPTGTYVLSIYTNDNKDTSWGASNEADKAIKKISTLVWKHFNPDSNWSSPDGADKF